MRIAEGPGEIQQHHSRRRGRANVDAQIHGYRRGSDSALRAHHHDQLFRVAPLTVLALSFETHQNLGQSLRASPAWKQILHAAAHGFQQKLMARRRTGASRQSNAPPDAAGGCALRRQRKVRGRAAGREGPRPGSIHWLWEFFGRNGPLVTEPTKPVCCRPASSCSALLRSRATIPAVNICCPPLNRSIATILDVITKSPRVVRLRLGRYLETGAAVCRRQVPGTNSETSAASAALPGSSGCTILGVTMISNSSLLLLMLVALEKLSQYGHIADTGNLRELFGVPVIDQPGDREALTVAQFHVRLHAARRKSRES